MQINSLIGIKVYQKQGFLQDGKRVPLTAVNVMGNIITQIKKTDKEGYNSLQLGIGSNKKAKKSIRMHAEKALGSASSPVKSFDPELKIEGQANSSLSSSIPRFFKEIRVDDTEGASLGTEISASEVFEQGDIVDVTGISKGKGWAGGVKRWGFHGGPRTHGQSDRERAPGSIGQTTTPGRVYKGKKMAGRMGQDTVTVKNLEIIQVSNDGILLIKGLVPGSLEGLVLVKKMGVNKNFSPLYKEEVEEPAEIKEKESPGSLSSSDDTKQEAEEAPNSEDASLSDSSAESSEDSSQTSVEATISSPVNEPPAVFGDNKIEESKEEVKEENANS